VLYSFKGVEAGRDFGDGANPNGGLVLDDKGAIYGTTLIGGYNCPHDNGQGCGTVFELPPPKTKGAGWSERVLYRFKGTPDGQWPAAGIISDQRGGLYGTTTLGGQGSVPSGTAFELEPPNKRGGSWDEILLYSFSEGGYGGYRPESSLTLDASGNLYGNAASGGDGFSGTIFRLQPSMMQEPSWSYAVLYAFSRPDGSYPASTLASKAGNLYGTTLYGGTGSCQGSGCGTVFRMEP
jgi:uncharacterized repeat protein (TIGR03803 family)